MMRFFIFLSFCLLLMTSCASKFEKIRNSNQPDKIYKAANDYYDAEEYDRAIALYDVVIQYFRGRQEAEDIFYRYADAHYKLNDFILASTYFKNYAQTFTSSDKRQEAEYMAAYSNYRLSPNYKLDQTYTLKAIEGFEQFVNAYPQTERATLCNQLIDEMRVKLEKKAFEQGMLYYNISQFQSALQSFEIMLKDFPESTQAEEVRYLMLKSSYILAQNSVFEKKSERFTDVLSYYDTFRKKHPTSKYLKGAKDIQKQTLSELETLKI